METLQTRSGAPPRSSGMGPKTTAGSGKKASTGLDIYLAEMKKKREKKNDRNKK